MKPNMMELSKFVKWSVFGDGCVAVATHNKDAHYSIERAPAHLDYVKVIESKLQALPGISVRVVERSRSDNGKPTISLRTGAHPLFTRIRERQYIHGHRVLDPHMLTLLDWEALAFLYQDDGSLCFNNKGTPVVRLSTCAYSYFENERLCDELREKFNTRFTINRASRGLFQLNLSRKDQDKFFSGISPFVVPSYLYKLPTALQEEAPIAA